MQQGRGSTIKNTAFTVVLKNPVITAVTAVAVAVITIAVCAFAAASGTADKNEYGVRSISADAGICIVTGKNGETIDSLFSAAYRNQTGAEDFLKSKAVFSGGCLYTNESGYINMTDLYSGEAQILAEDVCGNPSVAVIDGETVLFYQRESDKHIIRYNLSDEKAKVLDAVTCAGENGISDVYYYGGRIYYVDDSSRNVCSARPDGTGIQTEVSARVTAYFMKDSTIYFSYGTLLWGQRIGQRASWIYENEKMITEITATDSNVYIGWKDNEGNVCAGRYSLESRAFSELRDSTVTVATEEDI